MGIPLQTLISSLLTLLSPFAALNLHYFPTHLHRIQPSTFSLRSQITLVTTNNSSIHSIKLLHALLLTKYQSVQPYITTSTTKDLKQSYLAALVIPTMASSFQAPTTSQASDEVHHSLLPASKNSLGLAKRAIVGKVIYHRLFNKNAVKEILYKAWQAYEDLLISDKGPYMYLFTYKDELHAKGVMKKAPWYVMNHFLSLQYWIPEAAIAELDFSLNPF